MSGDDLSRRFDIVAETRRRWSEAEKAQIVAEACAPCTNVSAVARRHGLKPPLLFRWIKERAGAGANPTPANFLPVVVPGRALSEPPSDVCPSPVPADVPPPEEVATASDTIEMALHNGRRVWVGSGVDPAALKRIIDLLEG